MKQVSSDRRSKLGLLLVVVGVLLILAVPATYAWTEIQGRALRGRLAALRTSGAGAVPAATASPPGEARAVSPSAAPTTNVAPTLPPTPIPAPTAIPGSPPVRLVFPDLGIDAPVTEMGWTQVTAPGGTTEAEWKVPDNGVGHATNSALLGVPGNVVLSGHNNIYGKVFMPLSQAWPSEDVNKIDAGTESSTILDGRPIQLYAADGRSFTYRVTAFYRLHESGVSLKQREQNASYMANTPDPELTIITCWPPWSNTYRLVLRAQLVQP